MLNWNQIDTVLLDMDGTLLDLHYDNHFWLTHLPERYAHIHNIPLEESRQTLLAKIRATEGTLNWYCLDYWADSLNVDLLALKRETRHKIQERPHVNAFLQGLKNSHKRVFLVTNSHPAGTEIKLEATTIQPFFDDIISSHQFGYPKEDQRFWQALKQHTPFDNQRTLFIDDNLKVLNAAAAYGIRHIVGIHQPDSQQPRTLEAISAIYHFDEIMHGLNHDDN